MMESTEKLELKSSLSAKRSSASGTIFFNSPTIDSAQQPNIQFLWDELGSEAAEHARIWNIYNEESSRVDTATIEGSNRGIDVLLVFTGLFSGVLTTFIMQSYQQMIPKSSDLTNHLLSQLIADLKTSSTLNISGAPISVTTPGSPTSSQIHWVNGLWFAALSCSLTGALMSMLAKQWIQPLPKVSGSPRDRARQRQRRHDQLQSWHVFVVINCLPLLLHASLLLFFAGLIMLLWSGEIAIMAATFTIVAIAYSFYIGSMWMSLMYPECPYQHPISGQLRRWITSHNNIYLPDLEGGENLDGRIQAERISMTQSIVNDDDYVDARALVWLLQQSTNADILKSTLQAISGFPYEFTAFPVLREAGAIPLVLQQFSSCFRRDISFDVQWHVDDLEGAEKFCRAWVRLTHGTAEKWPTYLHAPLDTLKLSDNMHVSAIAACVGALNSLDSHSPQIKVLSHLDRIAAGELNYNELSQQWLLDTLLECSLSWELRMAVFHHILKRAVPVLLRLLQNDKQSQATKSTIALILQSLVLGFGDTSLIWDKEKRHQKYHIILIPCLNAIIQNSEEYGIEGELMQDAVNEFCRLAAHVSRSSSRFSSFINDTAVKGLSKAFLEGKIRIRTKDDVRTVDNDVLAEILHILLLSHDKFDIQQHPLFIKTILQILISTNNVSVAVSAVQLLEPFLKNCENSVVLAFINEGGFAALLRAAHMTHTDSQRLRLDSIRTLCLFIQSSVRMNGLLLEKQFDAIFESKFFSSMISALATRRWWLLEIGIIWVPALVQLCRVRPNEPIWRNVEAAFRDFAERNVTEEGSLQLLDDLDKMNNIYSLNDA